jgi:hypothetical protein
MKKHGTKNGGGPYQMMVGRMQMVKMVEGKRNNLLIIQQLGSEEKVPCRLCGEMVLNKLLNRLNHVNVRSV